MLKGGPRPEKPQNLPTKRPSMKRVWLGPHPPWGGGREGEEGGKRKGVVEGGWRGGGRKEEEGGRKRGGEMRDKGVGGEVKSVCGKGKGGKDKKWGGGRIKRLRVRVSRRKKRRKKGKEWGRGGK